MHPDIVVVGSPVHRSANHSTDNSKLELTQFQNV